MHPVVRFLRVALPVLFIAFVALIIVSYTRAQFPDRKADAVDVGHVRPDDSPSLVMDAFEDTHSIGGRVVSRIRAERTIGFESGWFTLESVELALFSEQGLQYSVTTGQAQFNPETKEAEAIGGVKVSSSEGLSISTQRVQFDGEHVTNRLPVDFEVGGWVGHSGSIKLRVADETLFLRDGVTATLAPHGGQQRVDLSSESARSYQRSGDLVFEGSVRVARQSEILFSDVLRVGTSPDTRELTGIAGEGNVLIRLLKGSSLVGPSSDELLGAGETRISADRFTGEVGDGSVIRSITILGEKLPVRAIMGTTPRREMTAAQLRVDLTPGGGVEGLHATGDASIQELGSAPRVIEADDVRVAFDPDTREPRGAILNRDVVFRDRVSEGHSQQAIYDIMSDKVTLSTVGDQAPTLLTRGTLLKARLIEISPRGGTLLGTDQVVMRYDGDAKEGAVDSVLFAADGEPVFVNADSVVAIQASRVVTFSGSVRAWQKENSIFTDEMQILRDGEEITGTGSVRIVVRQPADGGTIQSINARSERMRARRDSGRVELSGRVVIEESGRTLNADEAVFIFDRTNQIERMEALGNVVLAEASGARSARGDSATYRVQERLLRIVGEPAVLVDTSGEISGSEILFDTASEKVEVIGGEATYNPDAQ
jgi:lipopolysaccharide transport protein LptA